MCYHFFVAAFSHVQTAQGPEMGKMEPCERSAVAEFGISQDLWKERVDQDIQLHERHSQSSRMQPSCYRYKITAYTIIRFDVCGAHYTTFKLLDHM